MTTVKSGEADKATCVVDRRRMRLCAEHHDLEQLTHFVFVDELERLDLLCVCHRWQHLYKAAVNSKSALAGVTQQVQTMRLRRQGNRGEVDVNREVFESHR